MQQRQVFIFSLLCNLGLSLQDCSPASSCPASCQLPDCACSGSEPYVNGTRPQIVYLTFDDALTAQASSQFYDELFGRPTEHNNSNPNGCALRATHYVTHQYTDYSLVNRWWRFGHEIASHSITHRNNLTYWQSMTEAEWAKEMVGQRRITSQFANVPACDISGMRSPFLQLGGDTQFSMLHNNNFDYDCSWPTRAFGYMDAETGLYPYTMDYQSVQDCEIKPCPTCSYPGLWVQPMLDLEDEWIGSVVPGQGNPCSMLDACTIIPHDEYGPEDPKQVYDMLKRNFDRVYTGDAGFGGDFQEGNRAPWGLYMHAAWFFGQPWHFEGYKMFVQEISSYDDVWIVPVKAGLDYMRNPLSNEQLIAAGKTSGPFACSDIEEQTGKYGSNENKCGNAKSCRYDVNLPEDNIFGEHYMTICSSSSSCPPEYPWLETEEQNTCGGSMPCADCQP